MVAPGAVTKSGCIALVQCRQPLGLEILLVGVHGLAARMAQERANSARAQLCSPVLVIKEGCQKGSWRAGVFKPTLPGVAVRS